MIRIAIFFTIFMPLFANTITHYTVPTRMMCYGHTAIIRTFQQNGIPKQLVVDTHTLQTQIQRVILTLGHPCEASRYTHLLMRAAAAPWPISNDGITRQHGGMTVTTDLCPSSKPGFEQRLYEALIHHFQNPVPVTLFITKRWIDKHPAELKQFQTWQQEGKLAITWGNHTARHHYHPGKPLKHNFVLSPEEHLTDDILTLEKNLIEHGITPSVFFRFPGLVSDKQSIQTVTRLGLIPIGTYAWIAKGQPPGKGSIILLHGNKNEPKGVDMFLKMTQEGKIKHLSPLAP